MRIWKLAVCVAMWCACLCTDDGTSPDVDTTAIVDTTAWLRGAWKSECFSYMSNRHERWELLSDGARQIVHYCNSAAWIGPAQDYVQWGIRNGDTLRFYRNEGLNSYVWAPFRVQAGANDVDDRLLLEKYTDTGFAWVTYRRD